MDEFENLQEDINNTNQKLDSIITDVRFLRETYSKDMGDLKKKFDSLEETIRGNGKPGLLNKIAVLEERVSVLGRWVNAAIIGLVTLLVSCIGMLITIIVK